jgi:molybdopterin-guanine dinucleotide biosynthesis protein A
MTLGLILAGGLARRMGGGDKALRLVGGRTVLEHLLERLTPQVDQVIVNANGDPARFAPLPVVPDSLPDNPGPLAGVLAGMEWAAVHDPATRWLLTVPGDAPFIPRDLAARLHAASQGARIACAASCGRTHPVVALWPVALRAELRRFLEDGERKVGKFTADAAIVEWPAEPIDPFFNVNTQAELETANRLYALAAAIR